MKTMRTIMKKEEFDELQQSRRYRYGYQSFILLAFLLMFDNILYGAGLVWAKHPVNTFILMLVSMVYYISRCILGDAVVGPKTTPLKGKVTAAAVAIFAVIAASLAVGLASFRLNVKSSDGGGGNLLLPVCGAMWVVIGIVYLVKHVKDRNAE